jgi:hypothetical protein
MLITMRPRGTEWSPFQPRWSDIGHDLDQPGFAWPGITSADAGAKLDKTKLLGVPVLSEDEWLALLRKHGQQEGRARTTRIAG